MRRGSASIGRVMSALKNGLPKAVIRSGAVSPATRAMAGTTPGTSPLLAAGMTTRRMPRRRVGPGGREGGEESGRGGQAGGDGPAAELGEIDARGQAQGDAEERGQADQDQRSLDGWAESPARLSIGRGDFGEQVQVDVGNPRAQHVQQQIQ